ncbi:uncharacterized protein LOC113522945 [Galleria mellonella]|uniref:Uncharacterized protein LOC113522945 n=1 Tax=Galleria mellonella TaxID=7137 RepID=A0A6J1X4C4_GALME|nr:uncharacterized protein LOC113522945 [Galleria mellonella]
MLKMRQFLVPVILLAIIALSSSNVLPIISLYEVKTEPFDLNSQNDNIFSNKFQTRNILNDIFYNVPIGTTENNKYAKIRKLKYDEWDNNRVENDLNNIKKDNRYNGKGFRKEQWHNYPRQLDRLHKYLYDDNIIDKRNSNPEDTTDYMDELEPKFLDRNNDLTTNEFLIYNNGDEPNIYDAAIATTNPFLILKIRLACLSNKLESIDLSKDISTILSEPSSSIDKKEEEKIFANELNPSVDAVKVKRENLSESPEKELTENDLNGKRSVKKRIFSLWSRLQSLSPKGHELHHRRHIHSFYGLPNNGGSGVISAETRATLMRPPGSPLRWG